MSLAWVGGVDDRVPYVNVGDALSPVTVAMVSGKAVHSAPFRSRQRRMSAVGTIGQSLKGGVVDVWGSGCSPWANPLSQGPKIPYRPPEGTELRLAATRGPFSASLMGFGEAPAIPFGDPAMVLPLFHRPMLRKRAELGVVLHLSELADRGFHSVPKPGLVRYEVPEADAGIRLITMVAPPNIAGIRAKIDEILACRRIVSTSLHGLAIAEAYRIPCLYFGTAAGAPGVVRCALDSPEIAQVNARFADLYGGFGRRGITYWRQRKILRTDWEALIAAIDRYWEPTDYDPAPLMEVCPAGLAPLAPAEGASIWDHPVIAGLPLIERRAA
ncbi:MAG: polysaccharide pyruvyl transferase family protein [Pseudomonadota bacterium]